MGDVVANISLGRVVELANRVNNNDPANSAFILVPLSGTATDAAVKDVDTLTDLLATALDELAADGWNRKTLDDAGGIVVTVTDANDEVEVDIPNQVWTAVTAGAATRVALCYDSDTTAGTDANIIPVVVLDMAVTPSGGDITLNIHADGVYRAT